MKLSLIFFSFLFSFHAFAGAKSNVDLYKTVESDVEKICKEKGDRKEVSKCMSNWQAMMKKDCGSATKPWDNCFFDVSPKAKYKSQKSNSWVDVAKQLKN